MNKYIDSIQDTYFNKGIAQGVKSARIELLKSFINKGIINDAGLTEEEFNKLKSSKSTED